MKPGPLVPVMVCLALLEHWFGCSSAAESFKVAVIDQQAVMEKSKTGKRALEELRSFSATRQKIVDSDDEELKSIERSLQDPNNTLSEAARREKQELLRAKLQIYQRRVQEFNREVQEKQREMVAEYSKKIQKAAMAVAEREGYAAVLDKGNEANIAIVIYHQPGLDLTDKVVKEFDRQNQ
jgi:outer membrane protein